METIGKKQARWHIRCRGKVQHVGFRYTALYLAKGLNLTGWVENLPDGSVQMEVQGDIAGIRRLLIQLKSQPHIHIAEIAVEELPLIQGEERFRVC